MTPPIMLTVIVIALAAIGGGLLAWAVVAICTPEDVI